MKFAKNKAHSEPCSATIDPTMKAPVVPGSEDGILNKQEVKLGIQCIIFGYSDPAHGDKVTLNWGDYSHAFYVTDPDNDFPCIYNVNRDFPQDQTLADGPYEVYYSVDDLLGNHAISESVQFEITAHLEPGSLPAPVIPVTEDDNGINDEEAKPGVVVQTGYSAIEVGDSIVLHLQGFDTASDAIKEDYITEPYIVTDTDKTAGYAEFTIAYDIFQAIGEFAYANSWFIVTQSVDGSTKSSTTKKFKVDVVPAHS